MMVAKSAAGTLLLDGTPPKRLLVIVTRRIGDVLLATPVLRSIKSAWPDTGIDVLVFNGTQGVLAGNPDIDRVLTIATRPRLSTHLRFVARSFRRYDLALSLVPGDRPTFYALLGGRRHAGLLLDTKKESWKHPLLHAWAPYDMYETHTVLTHLAGAGLLGVAPDARIRVSWTEADEKSADVALATVAGKPYVVLHPYPKFNYKKWSTEGWLAVSEWARSRGYGVVYTGGPDKEEREYVSALAGHVPASLNLAGQLSLGAVARVISGAKAYVGPDTAVTHIAAALGVPCVTFFGPTDMVKWGPWPASHTALVNPWIRFGDQHRGNVWILQGRAACAPCNKEGCDRRVASFSDCLQMLPATAVIGALNLAVEYKND